jgi:thiamine biosynthesis lipoprotein
MSLINSTIESPSIHRFSHNAMNTVFEIIIELDDKEYAQQAASAVFTEIERLEEELSRFRPNSDISRINKLKVGEELSLSHDTFECLLEAKNLYDLTNGLFDITSGKIIDYWKYKGLNSSKDYKYSVIGMNHILLDESKHSINLLSNDLIIDLGGFGKGYAIDKASELLADWEINGHNGWPISVSNPSNPSQTIAEIILKDLSLSGSGEQKGTHIINPKTLLPIKKIKAAWSITNSAAISDAMSTSFMIMEIEDFEEFCNNNDFISGIVVKNNTQHLSKEDVLFSNSLINKFEVTRSIFLSDQ